MAHWHSSRERLERRSVSNLRLTRRPLCMAAVTLVFGLQATVSQAGPAQVRPQASASSSAMTEAAFAVEPIAGQLTARDANGQINIRKQPTERSPILSTGYNRDSLYIFKSALTPQGERWYFIENIPTGEQGWVHGNYVRLNHPGKGFRPVPAGAMRIDPITGTVNWDTPHAVEEQPEVGGIVAQDAGAWVNLRAQTNTDSAIRAQAQPGEPVYIYRSASFSSSAGQGQMNQVWYYVALLESGAEGWVHGDYVTSAWESDEPFDVGWRSPKSGTLVALGDDEAVPLREYVSRKSPVLRALKAGESVMLLRKLATPRGAIEGTWYEVELSDGTKGWVHGPNVREVA